jgi:hypothetical protein
LIGAQSVIEVFDTILGDSKATYRRTIKHELILTPNNLVGISETGFYVTNDHSSKTAWVSLFSNNASWHTFVGVVIDLSHQVDRLTKIMLHPDPALGGVLFFGLFHSAY